MTALKQSLKKLVFGLLGKEPEAVVVTFLSGEEPLARAMAEEVRRIVPDRRHFVVSVGPAPEERDGCSSISLSPGSAWQLYRQLRRAFRRLRIGQAAVLFDSG